MRQATIFAENDPFEDTEQEDFQDTAAGTVEVSLRDFQEAALDDVISSMQATQLWLRFSAGAVPISRTVIGPEPEAWHAQVNAGPTYGFVNVLYYFGGMTAIGAMSLFMTLGFEAMGTGGLLAIGLAYLVGCLKVADHFKRKALPVPAGLMGTLAVVLVPLVVWCVQQLLGWWPPGDSHSFRAYHTTINWRWIFLEFVTLAAATVMLWRYRLPFMVMPVAMTVWYMSMDVANALMQNEGFDWKFTRDVSVVFGMGTIALAMWVDVRCRQSDDAQWRQDFAFWLYLLGAIMFWGGLSLQDSDSEVGKFLYALLNVALVLGGAAIGRRVFTVLGALGVAGYLGYLSHRVFNNSMLFPFVLTLLGLGVVWLGVWWQKNESVIHARLAPFVPLGLRPRV
jgi:hypothetical protein